MEALISNHDFMYDVQALHLYLEVAAMAAVLEDATVKAFRRRVSRIGERVLSKELSIEESVEELNRTIREINDCLPRAPYPLCYGAAKKAHLQSMIVAFEHYLSLFSHLEALDDKMKKSFFEEAVALWIRATTVSSSAVATDFMILIKKFNNYVPEHFHYPVSTWQY